MPVVNAQGRTSTFPNVVNLSTAQTGNGASTNFGDRGGRVETCLLVLTTTIGATPTCTYTLEGSADQVAWFPVPYADSAAPLTVVFATFVVTTATTVQSLIGVNIPFRYFRITYSANTNVTNTANLYVF